MNTAKERDRKRLRREWREEERAQRKQKDEEGGRTLARRGSRSQ